MADNDIKIQITTAADVHGLEDASAAIKKTEQDVESLNSSQADVKVTTTADLTGVDEIKGSVAALDKQADVKIKTTSDLTGADEVKATVAAINTQTDVKVTTTADLKGVESVKDSVKSLDAQAGVKVTTTADLKGVEDIKKTVKSLDSQTKIEIETTADLSGANQVVAAIKRVEAEEQTLQQQRDARTRGAKYDDPTAGAAITARKEQIRLTRELEQAEQDLVDKLHMEARVAQQTADVVEAKSRVAARAAGEQAGAIKNLDHVFTNVGYQVTDFAVQVQGGTSAMVAMSQQVPQAVGALAMLRGATLSLGAVMSVALSPLTAISIIITALAIGYRAITGAVKEMTDATKGEEKATRANAEAKEYMLAQQKELQKEKGREFLADTYKREADELERQAKAIDRINQLRTALGNIEQQRANQEIQIAKLREGQTNSQTGQKYDVGVAEANALAVQLRTGIAALNGELGKAQQGAAQAQQKFDAAYSAYQTAINTHDPKANINELAESVDTARDDAESARQSFADTTQRITAQRGVLLNEVEIKLNEKEADSSVKVTAASTKAFDGVVASLKDAVAQGPVAAVEQIKVEVGTVTTAATTKATEVKTAIDGERTGTVAAIQTLTPNSQDTQAITKAVQDVGKGLSEQGDAFLSALNNLTAGIASINNRINQQQSQINQLFSIAR